MPINCPIQLIPFFELNACVNCMSYDSIGDICGFRGVRKSLTDILTPEERLRRLEMKERPQEVIQTHIHLGEKSLELNRRLADLADKQSNLDKEVQEHLSSHWDKKKGGKPKTYHYK